MHITFDTDVAHAASTVRCTPLVETYPTVYGTPLCDRRLKLQSFVARGPAREALEALKTRPTNARCSLTRSRTRTIRTPLHSPRRRLSNGI